MTHQCNRCIMDDASDKTILFMPDGTCNYCNDTMKRMPSEYFPNEEGHKKLLSMFDMLKREGKGNKYDCLVGVSGGIDSSYIIYLGVQYGLRMLAVHLDDGLDTDIARKNVTQLCKAANVELINIKPEMKQYKDLIKSFFWAGLPNLDTAQDNIIIASLHSLSKQYNLKYCLSGANFSLECILERGECVNSCDKTHIKAIHKQFGTQKIDQLKLVSFFEKYIIYKYASKVTTLYPLNYIDYNLEKAIKDLEQFSGYTYYGGKHYESVLTRFMQCCYLPEKYGRDKRKSHYSSMIVSGQMTREEAVNLMKKPLYITEELKEHDIEFLAEYFEMGRQQFMDILHAEPRMHSEYPSSKLNKCAGVARKFRKYLG